MHISPLVLPLCLTLCVNGFETYFIELAYNGTHYHGWQIQPNALTVQEVLNKALCTIFRGDIETTGCGRTDTGVHARQFFAHFNLPQPGSDAKVVDLIALTRSLNGLLPDDISVKRVIKVHPEAHARFDATLRSYTYQVHFEKDPFLKNYSWQVRDMPDIELMNQAAAIIMQYKDFSCFSKSNTQVKTNNCKIEKAEWVLADGQLMFHISADRFLRNMVRAIVGTLMMVGRHEISPQEVRNIIESKNRSNAGTSVPACGLYLTEVKYPFL